MTQVSQTPCRWFWRRLRCSASAFLDQESPPVLCPAPRNWARAQLGTAGAIVGAGALAAGGAVGAARLAGGAGLGAMRAGTALSAGAATAYRMGQATSGATGAAGVGAGLAGVARAGAGAAGNAARSAAGRMTAGLRQSAQAGREGAFRATGGKTTAGPAASGARRRQRRPTALRPGPESCAASNACARMPTRHRKPSRKATGPAPPPTLTSTRGRPK